MAKNHSMKKHLRNSNLKKNIFLNLSKKFDFFFHTVLTLFNPIHSGFIEPVFNNDIYACSKPSRIETKLPPSALQKSEAEFQVLGCRLTSL